MTRSILIIAGSARPNGNTWNTAGLLRDALGRGAPEAEIKLVDLAERDIGGFDYACSNAADELMSVVEEMLRAGTLVFATPVYWYAMATIMKNFWDRLTDLVMVPANRPKGRALAGRTTFLLSNGAYPDLPMGFEEPFRLSAEYLAMDYGGATYLRFDGDDLPEEQVALVDRFAERVLSAHRAAAHE